MVCTTITVASQKPIISQLVGMARATLGWADIQWYQDIAGNITIKVDNVVVAQGGYPAGQNTTVLNGLSIGSHNVCVDAT